ncbi:Amb-all domain-containing protein [Fusarium falciforme]|uniref:Amb-all domain-containing protein n=1 Tax=Fusarium falciforme TaxID=195108 RepID=UPI002301FCD5|nr:Amb-all domain-containing protein [Fusarium falciforme]WAO93186.1 Amb-all domain-containing protein [Fusarium falciforme]
MKSYALLSLLPAVLACANPKTNECAKAVAANGSSFCSSVSETAELPSWASACSKKNLAKECGCQFAAGGDSAPAPASEAAEEPVQTQAPAATTLATVVAPSAVASSAPVEEEPVEVPASSAAGNSPATSAAASQPSSPAGGEVTEGGSCGAAAVDELVGYGDGTTGGGSGEGVTVTSCADLTSAVANGGVIKIDGQLSGCDIIRLEGDTTILGVGSGSGLVGGGFRMKDVSNVILRNLKMSNPPEGKDLIDIESSTYVWVDHCDLSAEGITGDKDHYDGLCDAKRGSDFITISWTKFSDHWKASLIGHSDNAGADDTGKLHVTYHHNYWSNINSRAPSVRFGTAHIYSSCYEDVPTSGVNSRMGAQVLVEQNSFNNVQRAIVTNLDSKEEGFASNKNNIFTNSDTQITQEKEFTPPYSYTTDPASCICELVKAKAGTGVVA